MFAFTTNRILHKVKQKARKFHLLILSLHFFKGCFIGMGKMTVYLAQWELL